MCSEISLDQILLYMLCVVLLLIFAIFVILFCIFSPDNFIIQCENEDAATNSEPYHKLLRDPNKTIKIDHESMVKWKDKFDIVNKPYKPQFTAPEVISRNGTPFQELENLTETAKVSNQLKFILVQLLL